MTIAAKPQKELVKPLKPSLGLPLPALLNRVILFGAGAGLLTWGLTITATRVTSVTATKAFVNGQILTITSPISGEVQTKTKLDSGMAVTHNQLLLKINESLSKSQWVQNLKLDLITDQAKLESIEAKIRQVAQSSKVSQAKQNQQQNEQNPLGIETDKSQKVALARIEEETAKTEGNISVRLAEQNLKEAGLELKVAQRHAQVAKSKYDKYHLLAKQGAMATFSVEEVLNNWKVSQAQVEAAQVKIETAKVHLTEQRRLSGQKVQQRKLQNIVQSRLAQSSLNRLSISTNNIKTEDLNPELTELQRQRTELQVSIQAKQKAIAEAEKSSLAQKNYPVLASDQGVLWEVMVQNGEQINSGQPLFKQLNCDQLWVDAFVNIDALKRVKIGSSARVEIYGNNVKLKGWVKTIRSPLSGKQKLGQDTAISPPAVENQQLAQVRIELENSQELNQSAQNSAQFCQVGQVATVNIDPKDSLLANLPSW
jgi:multidrug resistance efflux pump